MTSSLPRSSLFLSLSGALGLAGAAPAAAQPPAAVMLHTSTCQPEADSALRRALEIELQALHVEPRWASTDAVGAPAPITLSAECDAESGNVSLRVWASEPRLVLSRFVALRDVDEPARARTLALVISEALGPSLASASADGSSARLERQPPSEAEPFAAPARTIQRRSSFADSDAFDDELFTTTSPYGMPHAFRLGTAAQARLSMRDSSVLLGAELSASGPVADHFDATWELSYAGSALGSETLDASWWSVAIGGDFVDIDAIGLAAGPRLALGHLSITGGEGFEASTERTLVAQIGLRSKLEVPIDDRFSALMTFGALHTLGVYATTPYTGLDEGLKGWMLSWSLGFGVGP